MQQLISYFLFLMSLTGLSVVQHVCVHAEGLCVSSMLGRDKHKQLVQRHLLHKHEEALPAVATPVMSSSSHLHHASDQSRVTASVPLWQQVKDSLCVVVFSPGELQEVWRATHPPFPPLHLLSWPLLETHVRKQTYIYTVGLVWCLKCPAECGQCIISKTQLWVYCVQSWDD